MRKYLAILTVVLATAAPAAFSQIQVTPRAQTYYVRAGGGPWMGVSVQDVTEDRVRDLKLKEERGVEVITVDPNGPAQQAGLKERDVILDYNGQRIEGVDEFKRMISETPLGRNVKLLISRDGATQAMTLKLGEHASPPVARRRNDNNWAFSMPTTPMPPMPPSPPSPPSGRTPRAFVWDGHDMGDMFQDFFGNSSPRLGIEGEEISGQLGEFFGVPEKNGVLVRSVVAGSAAEHAGVKAGDVIVKINGKHVQDMGDLREELRDNAGKSFPITVIRNKKETTLTVTVEKAENRMIDHM